MYHVTTQSSFRRLLLYPQRKGPKHCADSNHLNKQGTIKMKHQMFCFQHSLPSPVNGVLTLQEDAGNGRKNLQQRCIGVPPTTSYKPRSPDLFSADGISLTTSGNIGAKKKNTPPESTAPNKIDHRVQPKATLCTRVRECATTPTFERDTVYCTVSWYSSICYCCTSHRPTRRGGFEDHPTPPHTTHQRKKKARGFPWRAHQGNDKLNQPPKGSTDRSRAVLSSA